MSPDSRETHISIQGLATRSVRDGIAAHRAETTFPPTERRGVLSAPVAVFLELATLHLDLVAPVVLGDSLVRRARITPESLVLATAGWSGRGARLARRAAALVRAGVDSAMESRLRLMIILAGLPEPQVNFIVRNASIVRNADGEWEVRFDLCYPQLKLIIEYDGEHHRLDADQWSSDLKRREWLERQGWRIIVINSDAYYKEPRETLARIRQALWPTGAAATCRPVRPRPGTACLRRRCPDGSRHRSTSGPENRESGSQPRL